MANDTVQTVEREAENAAGKFLSDLISHGEKLVAADIPADVRKVLGALIHWTGNGGKFVDPEVFNPALSQEVAEAEAAAGRLQAENADLNKRLAALETLFKNSQAPTQVAPGEGAAPVAPAPVASPAPAVPAEGTVPATEGAAPYTPPPAGSTLPEPEAPAVPVVSAPAEAAAPTPPASE